MTKEVIMEKKQNNKNVRCEKCGKLICIIKVKGKADVDYKCPRCKKTGIIKYES